MHTYYILDIIPVIFMFNVTDFVSAIDDFISYVSFVCVCLVYPLNRWSLWMGMVSSTTEVRQNT